MARGLMTRRMIWLSALAMTASALPAGCSRTVRTAQADRAEQLDEDTFLHEHLPAQPMVTTAEAYRAMILLADGRDECRIFDQRAAMLVDRGITRPDWRLQRDECIDRGSVAWMVCRILDIDGGVNMRLLGSWGPGDRRYAVRELYYRQLLDSTPAYRYMSGAELVDLLGKADAYLAERGRYPAAPLDVVGPVAQTRPAGP